MPVLYHASDSQNRSSIESSGLQPNPGRLGTYVYATFTEGQAQKIAEHFHKRTGLPHDVWKFEVPDSEVRKVEEHPAWAGMGSFKEVCVDAVASDQVSRVNGVRPSVGTLWFRDCLKCRKEVLVPWHRVHCDECQGVRHSRGPGGLRFR
ncbi:unnamed protein product [Symbiodinium natans]|uniref:Uncharacterized protein n=1 Tax=Symbiodinium natans TaxID=878477 RepID=A0A812S3L3_9DINO|nr:unnamed protein product [Symbiodinium natans]